MGSDLLRWSTFALIGLALGACDARVSAPAKPVQPQAKAQLVVPSKAGAARAQPDRTAPIPGSKVRIAAGVMHAGSATGTRFRDPTREADGVPIALAAFAIDVLPFPNEPGAAPRTRVDRAEASALCEARGDRLCSELEWERACETANGSAYPWPGAEPSAACAAAPEACVTDEGAIGMGLWGREWTRSSAGAGIGDALRSAVVRGAARGANQRQHRCDARDAATPDSRSDGLTFRCCTGVAEDVPYPDEASAPPVVGATVSAEAARTLLARMPGTAHLKDFTPFSESDVQRALASVRAARTSLLPWRPVFGRVSWSPVPRERVEVLSGDSGEGAALLVYYPDVDGAPKLITSYETRGEHAPIVVAARADSSRELLFSTCWGCGGEGGALSLGEDGLIHLDLR